MNSNRYRTKHFARSLLLLMYLCATALSEAATLHVDADAPGPTHDGAGWGTAFKNIQDALAAAVSGDQIWVATGIYYPDDGASQTDDDRAASFLLQSGVEIIGGFKGGETDVGQRDSAANPTVLSGDIDQNDVDADANGIAENPDEIVGANSFHVVTASSVDSTALLDGFTITAGLADGLAAAEQDKGGGLLCLTGTTPVVQHCTLIGNRSDRGGAAYIGDASPTISASRFHANAAALGGGALYVFGDSDPLLDDCEFLENLTAADGGAVSIAGVAHPTFNRCRFAGNSAGRDGGAIYNSGASSKLESCSFSGNNAADDGGGIYNIGTSSSLELINCSVGGNHCVDAGGGVYNSGSAGIPTFRNTIIWNNAADPAHPVVSQSIHNSRATLQPVFSNCLIQHLDLSAIGSENFDGTDPANDPLFADQADPAIAPSREGDLSLQAVSPAIDRGDNAVIESPTDLSGNPRIHSATVDLGAYESAGPEVNPISPLVLPFNVLVQSDILDLADVFDASATSFGLMGVDPPGMINVSLDGSNLEVSGISGAVLGTYRVRVWASDGTMQSSYTVTIFINAPRLYVDRGAPAGGDGSTWASALVSLQDAITLAADPAVDDEIWVSRGAYYPDEGAGQVANHVDSTFNLPPGLRIYGGFAGDEVSPDERDLRGHASILSGDLAQDDLDLDGNGIAEEPGELAGTNAKHVVTIESPETRIVLLDGLTISAGRAEGGADETQRGGAIYCLAGALELVHCQLSGNYAQKLGGAIYSAGDLELANCWIRGNSTLMRGGGIYAESTIDLTNCVISGNKSGDGGGIYLFTSPSAGLVNCTLAGNSSYSNGGALASHASTIAMANTVIWKNVARTPGRTSYPDASFSGSVPTFFHCLVENHALGSDGANLDGTDPDKAPLFFAPPDPLSAPHSIGDPRVPSNSPLVGAGSNLANPTERDIAGNSRISQGTIDIGAFEATQGPAVISPLPGLSFPIDVPSQAGVADLAAVFDASARSFAVESVFPEGRFDASIGGTVLGIENIAGHSLGLTQIIVAASNASGTQTFYGISVRIVGERLYVRAGAAPGGNGSSWGQAMVYLQDALDLSARLAVDEIWVAAGTYYPDDGASSDDGDFDATFGLKSGQRIYGGFAGSETEFDQRNLAANRTLLSGDIDQDDLDPDGDGIPEDPAQIGGFNARHLFELIGVGSDTVVDGFTFAAATNAIRIEGGRPVLRNSTFIGNAGAFDGTALLIIDSPASVSDCRFGRNGFYAAVVNRGGAPGYVDCEFFETTGFGDAGAMKNRDSSPSLIRCRFVGNTAKQRGAAIFNRNSSIRVESCTFDGNMAGWRGGAIFDEEGSSTTAIDCVFINNSGRLGGGALFSEENSSLTLIGCNLSRNSSSDVSGGALSSRESSAILDRCSLTGNSAEAGGAIVAIGSQISMSHCILSNNLSSGRNTVDGGAIRQYGGQMHLKHCVISGNSTDGEGGAAFVDGILRLDNCTVTGNQAADRGGAFSVDSSAELHLTNSIVWNNQSFGATGTESASISGQNRTTASNSLVENIDLTAAGAGNFDGTNPVNVPEFIAPIDPAAAPSPAGDFRLQSSSPVIDRGDNSSVGEPYDLDSLPRIRDGDMDGSATVDLGAFEFQPSAPPDFASLFPGLEPGGDTNLNGRSNFVDYATGADPTASGEMFSDSIAITTDGDIRFSFFQRIGTVDIDRTIERAGSLQQQDWIRLLEHVDFRLVRVDMPSLEQQLITVEILTDLDLGEEHFFRQRLESQ